ncbi:hypothetical protein O181_039100 [Austropuccinia psidii MF-1]|uniref:Uncharacterized protein n=1 Tax=Austropuccinia psidii MF-1 TaxID=1389203 RepID=A0A9Q3DE82_9BASI|nr:hypothetical protein [Austropuccinia psidii MF-1]
MHIALGMMHNWLEGVLSEHFRHRWGFQEDSQEKQKASERASPKSKRIRLGSENLTLDQDEVVDNDTSLSSDDDDINLGQGINGELMTKVDMDLFQYLMQDIVTPTGATKLPCNLGHAKHGCLKAEEWLSVFTLIIPLIIPELYLESRKMIGPKSRQGTLLQNTGDLVQCTRISMTKVVRDGHAGRFYNAYNRYWESSKKLFNNPRVKPNNHYALHIPEQLKL